MKEGAEYKLQLNEYGNVDAVEAMPDGWHKTSLTVTKLKKYEIPYYKACVGFTEYGYFNFTPRLVNIIPDDFSDKERKCFDDAARKKSEKEEQLSSIELTQEVVSSCLYSINKEAKRKRDIQSECRYRAYTNPSMKYPGVHYNLHKARQEKEQLYKLKEKALTVAIRIWNLSPDGYHSFSDKDRDMYSLCGYTFHVNKKTSENYLGDIKTEITATRKRSVPPKKAIALLERFVSENKVRK